MGGILKWAGLCVKMVSATASESSSAITLSVKMTLDNMTLQRHR